MRRLFVICFRVGYVLLIAFAVWFTFSKYFVRPKARSGPTPKGIIWSRLDRIETGKQELKRKGFSDDYWPTLAEIADASTGQSNTLARHPGLFAPTKWGEVYIINRIGSPAYAFLSNSIAYFPEGYLITLEDLQSDSGKLAERLKAARAAPNTNPPASTSSPR